MRHGSSPLPTASAFLRASQVPSPAVAIPVSVAAFCAVALWSATILDGWLLWATVPLGCVLILLALIDLRSMLLPDVLTLPTLAAGIAVTAIGWVETLPAHILGAAIGYLSFAVLGWVYRHLRGKAGLGLGDAKLLAAAGAWSGWQGLPTVVLVASASALLLALIGGALHHRTKAQKPIAFGPYLCLGFWLTWLYGPLGAS